MAITAGGSLNSVPSPVQQTLSTNYLDFADGSSGNDWSQQYLPDLMEKEAEVLVLEPFQVSYRKLGLKRLCRLIKSYGLNKVDYI